MSDGGLLQKAMEQQETGVAEIVADAVPAAEGAPSSLPFSKIASTLAVGAVLPLLLLMWFGIYLDFIPITILTPLVILGSFVFVWWKLGVGLPSRFGGTGIESRAAFATFATFLLLLGTPFLLTSIFVGDMSLGEIEFDDSGDIMTINIRQNGGSGTHDIHISISQFGSELWSTDSSFSINKADGLGDYGEISLNTIDFYSSNALLSDSSQYTVTVTTEGESFTKILDSNLLSRTITGVETSTTASMTSSSDECGDKESCVKGISLNIAAGLSAAVGYSPSALPYADYTLQATLFFEGDKVAIEYPTITVTNTVATWDSNGGDWGSGSGIIDASIILGGSEFGSDLQSEIIPKSAWEEGDLGCYSFVVEVTQDSPWAGSTTISGISFYLYEENERDSDPDDPNNGESDVIETWIEVDSC
jgi:hypothetical protein